MLDLFKLLKLTPEEKSLGVVTADPDDPKKEYFSIWYPPENGNDGNLREEASIYDGYYHGICKKYYPNGTLMMAASYDHGLLDGELSLFYENGRLGIHCFLQKGKLHGLYRAWYSDGHPQCEAEYVDGKAVGFVKYWDHGNHEPELVEANYKLPESIKLV